MAYTTTPALQDALRRADQRVATRAEVWSGADLLMVLQPTNGEVQVDADNAFRRRCKVTLVDPDGTLTPRAATDALTPYGNELRLFRGVVVSDPLEDYTIALPGTQGSAGYLSLTTQSGWVNVTSWSVQMRIRMPQFGAGDEFRGAFGYEGSQFPGFIGTGRRGWNLYLYHAGAEAGFRGATHIHTSATIHGPTIGALAAIPSQHRRNPGDWLTFTVTVDRLAGVERYYFDGVEVATYTFTPPTGQPVLLFSPGSEFWVGRTDNYLGSAVDEFRWFTRALSADEVGFPSDPTVHLRMREGSGTATLDEVAGAVATLRNGAAWDTPVAQKPSGTIDRSELIPLGVFGIADVDVQDQGTGVVVQVDGFDRARKVSRASLADVYTIPAGTNYGTAIRDLINSRVPGLSFSFDPISSTTPLLVFDAGDDPWKRASEMADNIGSDLFFDADGVCVLRRRVSSTTAAWEFVEGQGATVLDVGNRVQDEQTYNVVVVTGEAADGNPPVRATASDTNATSPTRTSGPYGSVVRFFASQFITTTAQAQAVADALLARSLGLTEKVSVTAIPAPQLDAGDTVRITRNRVKVNDLYVIDALSVPLNPGGTMSVTTRKRRV